MHSIQRSLVRRATSQPAKARYSTPHGPGEQKSRHALWYSDTLPAMMPIFLLGSAVYLGLQLTHLQISHEKYLEEANKHIKQLESEIQILQAKRDEKVLSSESKQPTKASGWWWWR
ncbi:hypothetical protein AX15_002567 [Amanita polypyramis BW_CC]|nr:hypothetical protein AX15_002567 [Amanita polypyramis BW_CC]